MSVDRYILILVAVIAAAGLTIWLGTLLAAMLNIPALGWAAAIPPLLVGFMVWRIVAERVKSPPKDR